MIKIGHPGLRMEAELYHTGIWNWVKKYFEKQDIQWAYYFSLGSRRLILDENGLRPALKSIPGETLRSVIVQKEDQNYCTYIPFRNKNIEVFIVELTSKNKIDVAEINQFHYALISMISAESEKLYEYPSFLPFFLPGLGNSEVLNDALQEKKPIFFLNGQEGTGKKTFIANYALLHFGRNLDIFNPGKENQTEFVFEPSSGIEKLVFIQELALLEIDDQQALVNRIHGASDLEMFFIGSIYGLEMLFEREIITKDLFDLCMKNRTLFPAIGEKTKQAVEILDFILQIKGIRLQDEILKAWEERPVAKSGFRSMLGQIEPIVRELGTLGNCHREGLDLRDLVAKIENDYIRFALTVKGNSQNKIAKFLGISRGSLQHKLKKYEFPYHSWED